jgi:enamine deaminase RidA (YjgF/YER057c/UK114 family)
VSHAGIVTTAVVSSSKTPSLHAQRVDALSIVDRNLLEAGTDKSRILMVTCYITDIREKAEFNRPWDDWVDRSDLPLRACVGVALEGEDLVELVVTAAV